MLRWKQISYILHLHTHSDLIDAPSYLSFFTGFIFPFFVGETRM